MEQVKTWGLLYVNNLNFSKVLLALLNDMNTGCNNILYVLSSTG